jgi:hypothetical protein
MESILMSVNDNLPDLAQDLIRIHRAITRGLTVSVEKGTEFMREGFPDPGIRQGFTDYAQSLAVVLDAHHLGEDEIAFPYFRERLPSAPYERLSANHQEIEILLNSITMAITDIAGDGNQADLTLLVDGLRKVNAVWIPHILVEEKYFAKDALAAVMSPEEQGRISGTMAKHAQEHSTPAYLALPFVLFNLKTDDRASMAATLPDMVWQELIPKTWKDQWAPMLPFLLE